MDGWVHGRMGRLTNRRTEIWKEVGGRVDGWMGGLVDGDMNTVILMVSALMIILGAALIIRPRERAAPQPWEMGTQEVELEEELTKRSETQRVANLEENVVGKFMGC